MLKKKPALKILIGIVIVAMIAVIISLQVKIKQLEKEKNLMEQKIYDFRLTVEEMEYDLNLPREDYIEKYAREVLGYHKYNDIVFKKETDE